MRRVAINVERLAYALALVGPVDMSDTNEAYRAYAVGIAHEYESTEWPSVEWTDAGPVGDSLGDDGRHWRAGQFDDAQ